MSSLVEEGGAVLIAIAWVSFAAWFLLLGQWSDLRRCERCGRRWTGRDWSAAEVRSARPPRVDIVGRLVKQRLDAPARFAELERFESALATERALLLRNLPLAGALAALAPLLGLLGTILGMMETFGVLAGEGARDVGGFAAGISRALVTTEAGLVAALPILVVHGWLLGKAHRCLARVRLRIQQVSAALEGSG